MKRQLRFTHPNFLEYQEFIVNHENYKTLPNKFNSDGKITWVKVKDLDRTKWWDDLKIELQLPDRSSVARAIHPPELNGKKPCQICGESLSIYYDYLSSRSFAKLQKFVPEVENSQYELDLIEIFRILDQIKDKDKMAIFENILDVRNLVESDLSNRTNSFNLKNLSPGVMSNAPDRLDGFHSFNACCRKKEDTGRHAVNLARYSQDRRAYANWADGDWKGANRLMGVYSSETRRVPCPSCFKILKMTPDHTGPISLGFTHRMKFQPMCINCNSTKNNRMTYSDVQLLLQDELNREHVVSWHSKSIWDSLKLEILDDEKAKLASTLMRRNLHHILTLFSILVDEGFRGYLSRFLHPEYAMFDFVIENFDPATGSFDAQRYEVNSLNTKKNAMRYLRISFEMLEEYSEKKNRKNSIWKDSHADLILAKLITALGENDYKKADQLIEKFFARLAQIALAEFHRG